MKDRVVIKLTREEWEEVLMVCSRYAELENVANAIREGLKNDDKKID